MTFLGFPNSLYRANVKARSSRSSYQHRRSARDSRGSLVKDRSYSRDTRGESMRYYRQDRKEPRDTQRDKLQ